jgi:hypothetical protein
VLSFVPLIEVLLYEKYTRMFHLQADRKTSIKEYMENHGDIMHESLPPELAARYGG